jgi:O-antigen/teichoic acid export membrane protein
VTKATEMARVSAKGGFHLLWGLVVSTVISSVGTIVIASLLNPDDLGLYAIAIGAPNLIANFRDWGINTAIIRYSAQYNSEGNISKVKSVFVSGLVFELILGVTLTVISFFLSDFLAVIFQRPTIVPLIQISSIIVLSTALMNAATGAFTGLEKMHLNSIMLIVQALVKTGLVIGLVVLGLGTYGAVIGFSTAILIAGIVGALLMLTIYRSLPKATGGKLELLKTTKTMLIYGFPVSIGTIITGFLTYFYTWVMAFFVTDNALIGNYSVAQNFVVLITFFATPVTTMMFPAFSKLNADKDGDTLRNVFVNSVKYASMIVLPVTVMVMALAHPAIATIFGGKYSEAPLFLALLSVTYLYTALGNLSVSNLVGGQGYTRFGLKLTILTVAIGFPLSFIFTSQFGILGLIIASNLVGLPAVLIYLHFAKKKFGVAVDWVSSAKIAFSSGAAGLLTYLSVAILPFSPIIQLILGVVIFVVAFLFVAVVTRTISRADLVNIREIAKALGPLRKPLNIVIGVIEKIIVALKL